MLGSSFTAIFMFTTNGPRGVITCSRGSLEVTTRSYPFQVWEKFENKAFTILQISRFFLRMRETSEGTSYQMVRFVFRHFDPEEEWFARRYRNEPSPEIPLTLPFSGVFQGFSARYSHSNHSQDHGRWQVCMWCVGVCGCVLCMFRAVLCYICSKNMKKWINMENKTGWKTWSSSREKSKKNTENIGKNVKTWSPSLARYGHPRTPKRSKIGHFPRRIVFTFPLGFADDFRRRSYPKRQKKALFDQRS